MAFEPEAKQGRFSLLSHSAEAVHNAHLFAIVCRSLEQRNRFLDQAREARIGACFHYVPLHSSPYFRSRYDGPSLSNADRFGDCLVRLPMFNNMTSEQVDKVVEFVLGFEWE